MQNVTSEPQPTNACKYCSCMRRSLCTTTVKNSMKLLCYLFLILQRMTIKETAMLNTNIAKCRLKCCVGVCRRRSSTDTVFRTLSLFPRSFSQFLLLRSFSQLMYISHNLSERNSNPASATARSYILNQHKVFAYSLGPEDT